MIGGVWPPPALQEVQESDQARDTARDREQVDAPDFLRGERAEGEAHGREGEEADYNGPRDSAAQQPLQIAHGAQVNNGGTEKHGKHGQQRQQV